MIETSRGAALGIAIAGGAFQGVLGMIFAARPRRRPRLAAKMPFLDTAHPDNRWISLLLPLIALPILIRVVAQAVSRDHPWAIAWAAYMLLILSLLGFTQYRGWARVQAEHGHEIPPQVVPPPVPPPSHERPPSIPESR